MKQVTYTINKKMTIYRLYTRAQMNQRRVVGIVVISILMGSMVAIKTPTERQKEQIQKEREIKTCVEKRDNAFEQCVNDLWRKWGNK